MPTYPIDFTDPTKIDFNLDEIDISGGKAKLALQQGDVDFTENFTDDTDFTYDSGKAEFSGGQVQQKDQRPSNAIFGVTYTNNINGSWGDGTLSGSGNGGASVSGGKLDLAHNDVRFVDYDADGNADSQQTGCIRFKLTTNYSGAPGSVQTFVITSKAAGDATNAIKIYQSSTLLFIVINNNVGGTIISNAETWNPVIATPYEIELNWDITTGATRLFVDGEQLGSTLTNTGTRSSDIGLLRVGADTGGLNSSNFFIDDLIIFDSVQHTANYTPGYSVPDYKYIKNPTVLPEMEHAGDGTIKLFNSLSVTYSGTIGILLEIGRSGNKLYWDGDSWEISSDPYTQYTDPTTFNTNCGSLPVNGEKYGQFTIVFFDSNTQSSVDELTANINVDIGYLTTNPYGKIKTGFRTDELQAFIETATKTGSDEIKWILENDGDYYYWNGSAWTIGSLQYSNASTASDINDNRSSLVDSSSLWYVYFFLHSDDGLTTPELDNLQIDYSYAGEPDEIETCIVWGYYLDGQGNPLTSTITARLNKHTVQYKNYTTIKKTDIEIIPDDSGYCEVELIETENMVSSDNDDVKYVLDFGNGSTIDIEIPQGTETLNWNESA